jgi:DNA invertase Pin-like site-specific DNA recombinase
LGRISQEAIVSGKVYGYGRVSTEDQNLGAQEDALRAAGCDVVLLEKVSGADVANRPKLTLLMEVVGPGDTVIVCKLDRLSRDTLHMLELVRDIGARGAGFKSLAEPWCDTTTAAGELMLTVFAGVAQFERKRLKERQREGIERAKAGGVFKGGKVRFNAAVIQQKRAEGMKPTEIARHLGCNPATVFRALRTDPGSAQRR